jgi:hypothetical protein
MSRAAMQLALDALKVAVETSYSETTVEMFNAAIEALKAELAKPEPEPVAYAVLGGREIESGGWEYIASWAEACHEHINNAIAEYDVYGAGEWRVVPLYRKDF